MIAAAVQYTLHTNYYLLPCILLYCLTVWNVTSAIIQTL
jgi:hypothetical protein